MANNQYVNKVVYGATTLVDLTSDTVAADKMLSGYTAHSKSGAPITGTIQSKAAQTYTPSTTNQTIAAGKYLSGAQTIQGSANLTAANIKSGVTIFGVTGSYEGATTVIESGTFTANGTYYASSGHAYSPVVVAIPVYDGTVTSS